MKDIKIHTLGRKTIIELLPLGLSCFDTQEILDFIIESAWAEANIVFIHKQSLPEEFFELSTRIAGEIVQKAVNYRLRLVIIGEFSSYASNSLRDFIWEGNRGKTVNFFNTVEEALAVLAEV